MRSVFLDAPSWNHAAVPAWFAESQRSAWEAFGNLPMPGRRDEAWRFADLKKLNFDAFTLQPGGEPGVLEPLAATAARLVFVNDVLVSREVADETVEVLTLADALARHGDRLREILTTPDTGLGGAKFAALHQAWLQEAVVIVVPAGREIAQPVEIVHWLAGEQSAAFPRTIILTEKCAKVSVLERHVSAAGAGEALSCGGAQLLAGQGSEIRYVLLNERAAAAKSMHFSTILCARDASVVHGIYNLGAGWVRTESLSHVNGENGRSQMLSVALTSGDQEIDQRTLQEHAAPHTWSDLLYKNVLFDTSRTIFAGLIKVDEGAHFTDAYQKCRNLLLSEECEANSMPGLEINADQVKCSHGSTSGRIDEEELFYFRSRGISRERAAQLIAIGFAAEAVDAIGHEAIVALVKARLEARFLELTGV